MADVIRIEKFLTNQVSSHTSPTDFVGTDFGAKYMVKSRQSLWARDLLIKLRFMQAMDNLPNTSPKPWSERRGSYLRIRQGYAAMTLQFEAVVRRKAIELKNTREFQARIMGIALGGDVTDGDLRALQQDMDEQESEAASEQLMMNRFAILANASHKTVRNIDRLIEEGDKRERSRRR